MNLDDAAIRSRHIFDPDQALELTDGDQELLEKILQKFWKRYPELLNAVHQAVDSDNWEEGQDAAHTLKGNAAYLCAHELRDCAAVLEDAFKKHQADEIRSHIAALEDAITRLKAELNF